MKYATLADILRQWVGDKRLVDAAAELGCSVSSLSMNLRGQHVPWDNDVRRMAAVIGRKPDEMSEIADADRARLRRRRRRSLVAGGRS